MKRLLALSAFALGTLPSLADVPTLRARVNDFGEMLSTATVSQLEATLAEQEKRTGRQVVVLTVGSLQGQPLESYTMAVVEKWKLGRHGKDDGVLIFAAKEDRKMRIEVGYGLEGQLTDAVASRIIRQEMTPQFKAGNFDAGFSLAVTHVLLALDGKAPNAATTAQNDRASGISYRSTPVPLEFRILFGLGSLSVIGIFWILGAVFGAGGIFLYFFLIPFCLTFPAVALGAYGALGAVAFHLIAFPLARLYFRRKSYGNKLGFPDIGDAQSMLAEARRRGLIVRMTTRSSSGSSSSRSSSSSSSRSSSSSSSYRGGGGSFGGGGSSGSW